MKHTIYGLGALALIVSVLLGGCTSSTATEFRSSTINSTSSLPNDTVAQRKYCYFMVQSIKASPPNSSWEDQTYVALSLLKGTRPHPIHGSFDKLEKLLLEHRPTRSKFFATFQDYEEQHIENFYHCWSDYIPN